MTCNIQSQKDVKAIGSRSNSERDTKARLICNMPRKDFIVVSRTKMSKQDATTGYHRWMSRQDWQDVRARCHIRQSQQGAIAISCSRMSSRMLRHDVIARCYIRMSLQDVTERSQQQDATAGCQKRMPRQDATSGCQGRKSQQYIAPRCH